VSSSVRVAVTSRLVQPRKPSGKLGGGLGVKKLDTKVDETLFEQAPAAPEPPKPAPVAAEAAAAEAAPQASGSSRFAYDTLTAAPASTGAGSGGGGAAAGGAAAQRGKDGHLTLGEHCSSSRVGGWGGVAPGWLWRQQP
jgi:ADP-ribosylation factor GTPase-activating protein 2/3